MTANDRKRLHCITGASLRLGPGNNRFDAAKCKLNENLNFARSKIQRRSEKPSTENSTVIRRKSLPYMMSPLIFFNFVPSMVHCLNLVLACMTSSNPLDSEDRISRNGKRTVAILDQLCFGLSQKYNFSQEDNGFFLQFCNLSQTGLSNPATSVVQTKYYVGIVQTLAKNTHCGK